MSQCELSVVLPAHNEAATIGRAIRSLMPLAADEEIVVVDDHSTDGTSDVVAALDYERVRVVNSPERGLVSALNAGIEAARGTWIARADADDESLPGRLSYQRRLLSITGADLCSAPTQIVRRDGTVSFLYRPCLVETSWPIFLQVGPSMAHGSTVFNRDLVLGVGGYRESAFPAEDYDLWVRLFMSGAKFTAGRLPVYRYNMNPNGISSTRSTEQRTAHVLVSRLARQEIGPPSIKLPALLQLARNESDAGGRAYRRLVAQTLLNGRRRIADLSGGERAVLLLAAHLIDPQYLARLDGGQARKAFSSRRR